MNLSTAIQTDWDRQRIFREMREEKLAGRDEPRDRAKSTRQHGPRDGDDRRVHWFIVTNGGGHGSLELLDREKSLEKISGFKGGIGEGIGILTRVANYQGYLLVRDKLDAKLQQTAMQIGWQIVEITDRNFENGWLEWLKKRNGTVGADRWAISWTLSERLRKACKASVRETVRLTLQGNDLLDTPLEQRLEMPPSAVIFHTKVAYAMHRISTQQATLKHDDIEMLLVAHPLAIAHLLFLPYEPKWRSYLVIEQGKATLFTDGLKDSAMKHVTRVLKVTVKDYGAIYDYLSDLSNRSIEKGKRIAKGSSIKNESGVRFQVRLSEDASWGIHDLLKPGCRIAPDTFVEKEKKAHDKELQKNFHAWVTKTSKVLPEYNSKAKRLSVCEQHAIHMCQDKLGFNTLNRDWPNMDPIPCPAGEKLREFTRNLIWLAALLNSPVPYANLPLLLEDSSLWISTLRKVLRLLPTDGENRNPEFHSIFQFRRRTIRLLRRLCKSWNDFPKIWEVKGPNDITLSEGTLSQPGGYSRVYRGTMSATSDSEANTVALKKLVKSTDLRKSILREAIVWEQADHPHIAKFLGLFSEEPGKLPDLLANKSLYMVSNFIEGTLAKDWAVPKTTTPKMINIVLRDVIDALHYLHNEMGIVHCDMRASNIMVDPKARGCLIDFGLSNIRIDVNSFGQNLATTTQDLTNARWLPPEMFVSNGPGRYTFNDVSTDMWAFGCVIMELYTKENPWHTTPDGKLSAEIKKAVEANAALPWKLSRAPTGMDSRLWDLTMECWQADRRNRAGATTALVALRAISPS
ncbi:hypothetical protein JAAARDRAFT_40997 [Jaapia argillacea MUCL 33604]|uniref:Protein kinase domain-containing protein n=1 Tax=Jaapia argillacea MUCL 33604 TaxID=933084 RepID=A0A067PKL0_9AGAM|nr:hypothetical protein JAAARDRAFT_40997 [Jaapia argillacea MUCL 33604]